MRLMVGDFLLNVWDIVAFGWGVGGRWEVWGGEGGTSSVFCMYIVLCL